MRARRAIALRRFVRRPSPTLHTFRVVAGEFSIEHTVAASNWLEALGLATERMGDRFEPMALERVDLSERTVLVRLLGTGRSFCIQRLVEEPPPPTPRPPSAAEAVVAVSGIWELL